MAKAYQERLIALVRDTVTLLCKNGLEYSQEFCVEGLLGVTLDKGEVFLIPIKEFVSDKGVGTGDGTEDILEQASLLSNGTEGEDSYKLPKHERRKKRRHMDSGMPQVEGEHNQQNTSQAESSEYNDGTSGEVQPSVKRANRQCDVKHVKEEDIVVIKEEIDDQQFLDTFQGGSLDQSALNRTEQGDNGMTLMPQPGTSQGAGVGFSLDQLARDSGLPGAVPGSFPAGSGGDTSWLQHSQSELGDSQDWQNQKHQVCTLHINFNVITLLILYTKNMERL